MSVSGVITTSALGRPFSLGMLYDCRSDQLIPGVSLWKSHKLEKHLRKLAAPSSDVKTITSDKLQDKADALKISGELKLSLLAGLVKASGSGEFFQDQNLTSEVARVTLKYESRSEFEQLSMEHLGNPEFPEILDDDIATHVVTGIEYGCDAFFTFEKDLKGDSRKTRMDAGFSLETEVGKLAASIAEGRIEALKNVEEKSAKESIRCKFFGDLQLKEIPTSFGSAVDVIKTLPQQIQGIRCPKRIYLLPLETLNGKASRVFRRINDGLIDQVETVLQNYVNLRSEGDLLVKNHIVKQSQFMSDEISKFMSLVQTTMNLFKQELRPLLPKIRGSDLPESTMSDLISNWTLSNKSPGKFFKCLKGLKTTINILTYLVNKSQEKNLVCSFDEEYFQPKVDLDYSVFVFSVSCSFMASKSLQFLEKLLLQPTEEIQPPFSDLEWHQDEEKKSDLLENFEIFLGYHERNKSNKVRFMLSKIRKFPRLFRICCCKMFTAFDFEFPCKPSAPEIIQVKSEAVKIRWNVSEKGASSVLGYVISFLEVASSNPEVSVQRDDVEPEAEISHLEPSKTYTFKVKIVSAAGMSVDSEWSPAVTTERETRWAKAILSDAIPDFDESNKINLRILTPRMTKKVVNNANFFTIGGNYEIPQKERTIMVIGDSSAGKTTFLNSMANYALEVQEGDDYRFKIFSHEKSRSMKNGFFCQTKDINIYVIQQSKLKYRLCVVDTPGFTESFMDSTSRGMVDKIRKLFEGDVDTLDVLCIVVKASDSTLSAGLCRYFNSVMSLFGPRIHKNTFIVATFSDASEPIVKRAVSAAKIKHADFLKFNASAFFEGKKSNPWEERAKGFYWQVAQTGFDYFFERLECLIPISLTLSTNILRQRDKLQNFVDHYKSEVSAMLWYLEELNEELETIQLYSKEIEADEEFDFKMKEVHLTIDDIAGDAQHTTACMNCNFTCHFVCQCEIYSSARNKMACVAMDSDGMCQLCPGKCHWHYHRNTPYVYVRKLLDTTRHQTDLKMKYGKYTVTYMKDKNREEFIETQRKLGQVLKIFARKSNELKMMHKKPSKLSVSVYIDQLISEEETGGFVQRVRLLRELKNDLANEMNHESFEFIPKLT